MTRLKSVALLSVLVAIASLVSAGEPVDLDAVTKIRQQGFRHSQVMDLAWNLTEGIGPRLTGTPQELEAHEWAKAKMEEWGMTVRLDSYEFGRSWIADRVQVRMLSPYVQPLEALSAAWAPGTDGPIQGRVVRANLENESDLEKWTGKLEGAIILTDDLQEPEQIEGDLFHRWDEEGLEEVEMYELPSDRWGNWRQRRMKRFMFREKLAEFYAAEGVLAVVEPSSRDNGIVRVSGNSGNRSTENVLGVPSLTMATEQYNRLVRMLDRDIEPILEIDVDVTWFIDRDAYNTIADLPGSDLAGEIVVVGAHLDSWHTGTGATDNGGSCAVVMEALRIIKDAGLQPRRTIRVGLWSGEEQGLLGSRDYVSRYLATRPETTDPEQLELPSWARETTWPIQTLPGFETTSVYFNLDNGNGRIRGIWAEENAAAVPIFEAWFEPLEDLGVTTVSMRTSGGTDHMAFDRVGIPGFQFIQDRMDYMGRTHHTNVDTYDHLHADDLKQSAVVIATVIWHAANRDEMFPRKPMPTEPEKKADEKKDIPQETTDR